MRGAPRHLRFDFSTLPAGAGKNGAELRLCRQEDAASSDASPRSPDAPAHAGSPARELLRAVHGSRIRRVARRKPDFLKEVAGPGYALQASPGLLRFTQPERRGRDPTQPRLPLGGVAERQCNRLILGCSGVSSTGRGFEPLPLRSKGYRHSHSTPTRVSSQRPLPPAARDAEAPDDRVSADARRRKP